MRKSGDAVIPINPGKGLELVAGARELQVQPAEPYGDLACDLLDELSKALQDRAREFPDIAAFAFWCRKGSIRALKTGLQESHRRLGRGLVFHVAPSNVPINFAFSYAFGLIAGNANLVRLPSEEFPQAEAVCQALRKIFENERFAGIRDQTAFVRYPHDDAITTRFSLASQARVIWGGDETVRRIRSFPSQERTVDIAFADRYSFCALDAPSVAALDEAGLKALAAAFYNDCYLMDQGACSSPHLIIWQGSGAAGARVRFWDAVAREVGRRGELSPIQVVSKYARLCENLMNGAPGQTVLAENPSVYRVALSALPSDVDRLRGQCGLFYEVETESVIGGGVLDEIVNAKYQTLTYFGIDPNALGDEVVKRRLLGIDRIVPVGKALEIGVYWDGFDVVRGLSRVVCVQ
jgi:hypothetical protein